MGLQQKKKKKGPTLTLGKSGEPDNWPGIIQDWHHQRLTGWDSRKGAAPVTDTELGGHSQSCLRRAAELGLQKWMQEVSLHADDSHEPSSFLGLVISLTATSSHPERACPSTRDRKEETFLGASISAISLFRRQEAKLGIPLVGSLQNHVPGLAKRASLWHLVMTENGEGGKETKHLDPPQRPPISSVPLAREQVT